MNQFVNSSASSMLGGDRLLRSLLAALVVGLVCPSAFGRDRAAASARLEVVDATPGAVIGRPVAVPIRIDPRDLQRPLPESVELRLDDDSSISGLIAWIGMHLQPGDLPILPVWTGQFSPLRVITAPDSPALRSQLSGVILLTPDEDYSGSFRLEEQSITPRWMAPAPRQQGEMLPARVGPDWPPLDEPADWWRWSLIADSEGAIAPDPAGDPRSRLIARNIASLWRAGLDRIERASPGTADELRDLLVARCRDDQGLQVAAWITDTDELNSILGLLIDLDRPVELTVRSLLFYLDARFPVLAWPMSSTDARSHITLANPTDAEQILRIQWVEDDPVPVAAIIPPGRLLDVVVDRPVDRSSAVPRSSDATNTLVLSTTAGPQTRLEIPPRLLEAKPPGLQFGPFLVPMNLSQAWDGELLPQTPGFATSALLRKRRGRWELFIECLVGTGPGSDEDLIEVHLGPPNAPVRLISVAADGRLVFSPGSGTLRGAEVSISHFPDRWRAVLSLDPSLVQSAAAPGTTQTMLIGMRRLLNGNVIGVSDGAAPAWDPRIPVRMVDLSEWGDIPTTRNPRTP
ncbi:MAG: hypothetical protein VX641_02160 [Planctomycetota bacterium]|nr:hypothetical protein [Planctomycetota bacterium]